MLATSLVNGGLRIRAFALPEVLECDAVAPGVPAGAPRSDHELVDLGKVRLQVHGRVGRQGPSEDGVVLAASSHVLAGGQQGPGKAGMEDPRPGFSTGQTVSAYLEVLPGERAK